LKELELRANTLSRRGRRAFSNDFSELNPTLWANEAIIQLLPNMVIGNLISRDFDPLVSRFGDIVNAFVPSTFTMNRKGALNEAVVVQNATGSRVQVPLNQWPTVSFLIADGEENRDQLDLVDTLLTPAVIALATGIDRILAAQVMQYVKGSNVAGHAGGATASNIQQYMLEIRQQMNTNNVPLPGRTLLMTPTTETDALQVQNFTAAYAVGDDGSALREAALGRKYGFDIFMTQTQPQITGGQPTIGSSASVTCTLALAVGATTAVFAGSGAGVSGANLAVGQWFIVAGDDTPQQITALSGLTVTSFQPGIKHATAGAAAVTIIADGAVNNSAGYSGTTLSPRVIGYAKEILVDGFSATYGPQIGQLVSFGTDTTNVYCITQLNIYGAGAYGITLDQPLVNSLADNAVVHLGPAASYNFAFLRNAFSLVNRPLAEPRVGLGAVSKTIMDPVNKISLRVTMTYDGVRQGTLVTLDTLMGVGVLSSAMGGVMLA
jgi:hypothetical protein